MKRFWQRKSGDWVGNGMFVVSNMDGRQELRSTTRARRTMRHHRLLSLSSKHPAISLLDTRKQSPPTPIAPKAARSF
jgi:hypothetical protein